MSYIQAIKDGFSKYAEFSGRSSRSAYWWWTLFSVVVAAVTYAIGVAVGTQTLYVISALVLFLPGLGVAIRRLHDTGRSGWWLLIGLVPIIGGFVLLFFMVQPSEGPNAFGAAPDTAAASPARAH